jgi:hypothetical protein
LICCKEKSIRKTCRKKEEGGFYGGLRKGAKNS